MKKKVIIGISILAVGVGLVVGWKTLNKDDDCMCAPFYEEVMENRK